MSYLIQSVDRSGQQKRGGKLTVPLLILLAFCLLDSPAIAEYGGGTGEPNDPFLIYTADQMNAIGAEPNDWDKHFKLMADIDLAQYTGQQFNIIGYDRGYSDNKPFKGVFDGGNHTISNFTYSTPRRDCVGIFGYVLHGAVRDVRLVDPNVEVGWGDYTGSLAGQAHFSMITNCSVEGGSVSGRERVGGLAGRAFLGETLNCSSTATVSGHLTTGGLLGESRGTVTNCHTAGDISGSSYVGGLIGYSYERDVVTACWSRGNVHGESGAGGLVGMTKGTLQRCYSAARVTSGRTCGGIAQGNSGKVFWCYAEGTVTGTESVGGLLAHNSGKVFSCYSTATVTGETDVGGLIGRFSAGWVQSCFWDTETSGVSISAAGMPRSTAAMKTAGTFRGWHSDGYWTLDEGMDYPRLVWETRAAEPIAPDPLGAYAGTGEPNDPYQIRTPAELVSIAYRREDWEKHFVLMRDLDMSDVDPNEIMPIGDELEPFAGVFDGAGLTISNYTCLLEEMPHVGVFGILVAPEPDPNGVVAVVKNLHLVNATVRGGSYVGGLVGWNRGTVTGCSFDGSVSGNWRVGGLVGGNTGEINTSCSRGSVSSQNGPAGGLVGENVVIASNIIGPLLSGNGWARISRCFSSARVNGRQYVGGLVGQSNHRIVDCYASGVATGADSVGGLVGSGWAFGMRYCYSTTRVDANDNGGGLVGSVGLGWDGSAFWVWDAEVSGIGTSLAGRGKTTEEMMSSETYYAWGADGNWTLDEDNDYPRLAWENRVGRPLEEYERLYGGGSGDPNDPYQIWTTGQFITIGWYPEDFDKHFLLMADLDFNDISSAETRPIGNAEVPFTGVFDGQGHEISNIRLNQFSRRIGVFGVVGIRIPEGSLAGPSPHRTSEIDAPGFIRNLKVTDAETSGLDIQGVLAGFNVNGTISGCSVTGTVGKSSRRSVFGGLVGRNMGLVDRCRASCNINGQYFVGGLVGSNYGVIRSSHSAGEVSGSGRHTGGLAGDNLGTILQCYSQCRAQEGEQVGGLVGTNGADIFNCASTGDVSGQRRIGGLVGLNYGRVTDSYNTGSVSGSEEVGGLIGSNGYLIYSRPTSGRMSTCYSIGGVSGVSSVGGLVGHNVAGTVTACFWDTEAGGPMNMCGNQGNDGTGCDDSLGKSTTEMQTADTFLEAGWDLAGETTNGTEDIWWILEGQGYPRLWWEPLN